MENTNSAAPKQLGAFPFVLAGLSFIPLIGMFFGLIAIIWGIIKYKHGGRKLILVSILGICTTFMIYRLLFYFGFQKHGGLYDNLRQDLAQQNLASAIKTIEFYKVQNGHYPTSLEKLDQTLPEPSLEAIALIDPSKPSLNQKSYFYYELLENGSNYYLLGTGADNLPFTKDDTVPKISNTANLGLVIHP